ncbi:MAG: response regulator [Muribaculaceae bacterium]|nr:response regulator [Muribaculaceae bacterium]
MYHCHVHFCLSGQPCSVFDCIKKMEPLEHFTHQFSESSRLEADLIADANVIFVNLQQMDVKEALEILTAHKKENAELILLAEQGQLADMEGRLEGAEAKAKGAGAPGSTEELLAGVKDIWILPMSDGEVRFRLARWQQAYKKDKDDWQTRQYLEAAINHIPNLVWYKDKDGVHEKVNDSFCKTVNKTKEQVEGRRHAYIWDVEEDDPACIESENEVMSKKETCIAEELIKTGEGMRTLTTYKSPLYDLDGSVMGTVGVAIDITQERAYEQEIIGKNQTLETIFKTIDCGVVRHTLDGKRILSVNSAALKILGYESQEELMRDGFDMIAESVLDEDKEKLRECMSKLKEEGNSVSVEYRVQHKDGTILHIMGNVKLLRENGKLVYQRFLLDCTEQKQQERKKEKRHAELVQALSTDYSVVCFFDLDTGKGFPIQVGKNNEADLDTIFQDEISLEESIGHYIEEFVYEDDKEMMHNAVAPDTLKTGLAQRPIHYVGFRIFRNGRIMYFQMKVARVGTWDGNYGIVLGLRSVDDEIRKELEQKSLLEDALSQAKRASKAKSVFLSNMSHDIRTPMNAIVGFTNLALNHIDNKEKVEEYLKKIVTSGNHLLSLINDVLDMSHIESGKINLEEKQCSLPDILHGLRNILQADIHAKQMELHIDTVDVLDEDIYCDKLRLNQVLLNLLSNSVKYTGAGGMVSMRITEKTGAPEGYANYEFCVKDNGIGMSPEFVEHIFEPFEREKNTTASGVQGTGLGMAITKNIVDMMNGTIEVKSEQGVGTEFTVNFMFRLCAQTEKVQEIQELKDCRALVVDDDYNTCDSVSYMLGQLGLRAEWTLSGKEAVLRTHQANTRKDEYGVYIIDWLLPDMNGVEVTRRIRKEIGGKAPVIVLTAYDWSDIEEEAREAGVTAFCSKPLFLSELKNCLLSVAAPDKDIEKEKERKTSQSHAGRILLAEDVDLNQEIATAILGDAGFTTEVAENGKVALEMLQNSEPGYYQLILMDVQMPVMNGYEATKAIRGLDNKELSSIPIIAMTANAFEEDKREALRSGMDGHIAKPINIENLLSVLDKILG